MANQKHKQIEGSEYKPVGRKAKCTKEDILEALKANKGLIYRALKATGLSSATFYTWKAEDPEFAKAVDATEQIEKDFVRCKLAELIEQGDRAAILFYNKCKNGFTETKRVEATVATTDTIDVKATLEALSKDIQ